MKSLLIVAVAFFGYQQVIGEIVVDLCTSQIYCQSRYLDTVQRARVFNDSKSTVDLVQKQSENETLANFNAFMTANNNAPTRDQVVSFVNANFVSDGELVAWTPSDFQANPAFLNDISDPDVKAFATKLNNIWPLLARKVNESVLTHPDRHSLIPVPNGFIIPGGRFKELYYWDSYWIVKGLLVCGMNDTARGMLENLISLVKRYGFVPNGSRVYYLNRSQPPLLSLMVGLYIDATGNTTFLRENIDTLEQELKWWLDNRVVKVRGHTLVQYSVKSETPRPESYYEDLVTCSSFGNNTQECYKNIKSAAESGWDFSTRWLIDKNGGTGMNLTDISTNKIVPVDLNAFLCGAFGQLSRFYKLIHRLPKSLKYQLKEHNWKNAIKAILYNTTDGIWKDWDLKEERQREGFYPSSFAPLWTQSYDTTLSDSYGSRAADYFNSHNVQSFAGGVPTSLLLSGQQWDLPNAWPPLQDILILGLDYSGNTKAKAISDAFANKTLRAFMIGMNNTNEMFEKYDAITVGEYGGGGEYTVQSGFGWSNGVAFSLIQKLFLN